MSELSIQDKEILDILAKAVLNSLVKEMGSGYDFEHLQDKEILETILKGIRDFRLESQTKQ